jgi:hypothetical protein
MRLGIDGPNSMGKSGAMEYRRNILTGCGQRSRIEQVADDLARQPSPAPDQGPVARPQQAPADESFCPYDQSHFAFACPNETMNRKPPTGPNKAPGV